MIEARNPIGSAHSPAACCRSFCGGSASIPPPHRRRLSHAGRCHRSVHLLRSGALDSARDVVV